MSKGTPLETSNRQRILSALESLSGLKVDAHKFIARMAKDVGTDPDTVKRVIREHKGQVTIDADGNLTVVKDAMLLNTTSRVRPERRSLFGVTFGHDRSRRGRRRKR